MKKTFKSTLIIKRSHIRKNKKFNTLQYKKFKSFFLFKIKQPIVARYLFNRYSQQLSLYKTIMHTSYICSLLKINNTLHKKFSTSNSIYRYFECDTCTHINIFNSNLYITYYLEFTFDLWYTYTSAPGKYYLITEDVYQDLFYILKLFCTCCFFNMYFDVVMLHILINKKYTLEQEKLITQRIDLMNIHQSKKIQGYVYKIRIQVPEAIVFSENIKIFEKLLISYFGKFSIFIWFFKYTVCSEKIIHK